MPAARITREQAMELFVYDDDAGKLYWRERPASHFTHEAYQRAWNTKYAGRQAGSISLNGYRRVNIGGCFQYTHRIIWLLETGEWPDEIDHINGRRTDNRFANMREVDRKTNGKNASRSVSNSSGVTGVSFDRSYRRWVAYITVDGAKVHVGQSTNKAAAIAMRKAAEREYGYHHNHGKEPASAYKN